MRCSGWRWPILLRKVTHLGRVTHICVSKLTIIGSDNGLSPGRRQAIIWTNGGILVIGPLGTNSEIWIKIGRFSLKKMHLKNTGCKPDSCFTFSVSPEWCGWNPKDANLVVPAKSCRTSSLEELNLNTEIMIRPHSEMIMCINLIIFIVINRCIENKDYSSWFSESPFLEIPEFPSTRDWSEENVDVTAPAKISATNIPVPFVFPNNHRNITLRSKQDTYQQVLLSFSCWGWDKVATILQTTYSDSFSRMKVIDFFLLKFQWNVCTRIKSTISQRWFM